jgi:hypothetical protein
MKLTELEERWNSIINEGVIPFRSLRISADCIPELYIALDINGKRYLLLQIPSGIKVPGPDTVMANISLEWREESNFILIGLLNPLFTGLYNELTLSLYNKIKDISIPEQAVSEFVNSFQMWVDFFGELSVNSLSDSEVKGLFGELTALDWYIKNNPQFHIDDLLASWVGPYGRSHDFYFNEFNVEIKSKSTDQQTVHISSEFQLQPESGKSLKLCIVDLNRVESGMNLSLIINDIKTGIRSRGGDTGIFVKALARAGLRTDIEKYDHLRFHPVTLSFFGCVAGFPCITTDNISAGISNIKYDLDTTGLDPFLSEKIIF